MKLNWRHKAGLFLTLIAAGTGLLMELSVKQALGIALIGVAFAWLLGTLTLRLIGLASWILISLLGLYLAFEPIWSDWNSAQKSTAEYDPAISDLQLVMKWKPVSNSDSELTVVKSEPLPKGAIKIDMSKAQPIMSTVTLPDAINKWVRPDKEAQTWLSDHAPKTLPAGFVWERMVVEFPASMPDTEIMRTLRSQLLVPRPTFSLASVLRAHVWKFLAGFILFASGFFGGIWSVRRGRSARAAPSFAQGESA